MINIWYTIVMQNIKYKLTNKQFKGIWCLLDAKINIYLQDLLLCVKIVLCQSFNLWIECPKPSTTWYNDIFKGNDSFAFMKRMFRIYDVTTFMSEVARPQM